jgi:hypothetical protein
MRFLRAARHHGNQIILADAPELAMGLKLCVAKKMLGFCKKTFHCNGSVFLLPCPACYAMIAATKHHHLGVS